MTGRSRHDWAVECADLNVQGYVQKPFDPPLLIKRLKNLVGSEDFTLLRKLWGASFDAKMSTTGSTFREVIRYVSRNIRSNVTRDEVAAYLDVSPEYLSRLFCKECGMGLKEYTNQCKIEQGLEYLANRPHISIANVAASVGIPDVNYFGRLFKKQTGISPGEFRKKHACNISQ